MKKNSKESFFSVREIIGKSKKFLKDNKRFTISSDPNFFLTSWAKGPGYLNLKKISGQRNSIFSIVKEDLKLIFNRNYIDKIKIENNFSKKYKNIIISYFDEKNLKKNKYYDKYFNLWSNELKKTLLILIPTSKKILNTKKFNNLLLLKIKYKNYYLNLISSILIYFYLTIAKFLNKKKYSQYLGNSNFNSKFNNQLYDIIKNKSVKNVYFPYEAQPHQHSFTLYLKKKLPNIKIFGYMHTVLPALPVDYIKRDGYPDKIFLNGKLQKKILYDFLDWKKKDLVAIKSFRYHKNLKENFSKKIFLPYDLHNIKLIVKNFENLILNFRPNYFPSLKIRNHPAMKHSTKHNKLIIELEKKINNYKMLLKSRKNNQNISIFIGSTASVVECLERNIEVYHITENPIFESYNPKIWTTIHVNKIDKNLFSYRLKKKGYIINFGNKKTKLKKL